MRDADRFTSQLPSMDDAVVAEEETLTVLLSGLPPSFAQVTTAVLKLIGHGGDAGACALINDFAFTLEIAAGAELQVASQVLRGQDIYGR